MLLEVDSVWKFLLMMGIGVFKKHKCRDYSAIMSQLANEQQITSERRKQLDIAKGLDALKDKSRQIENDILQRVEQHRDATFSLTGSTKKLNSMLYETKHRNKNKNTHC